MKVDEVGHGLADGQVQYWSRLTGPAQNWPQHLAGKCLAEIIDIVGKFTSLMGNDYYWLSF